MESIDHQQGSFVQNGVRVGNNKQHQEEITWIFWERYTEKIILIEGIRSPGTAYC